MGKPSYDLILDDKSLFFKKIGIDLWLKIKLNKKNTYYFW